MRRLVSPPVLALICFRGIDFIPSEEGFFPAGLLSFADSNQDVSHKSIATANANKAYLKLFGSASVQMMLLAE